MAAVTGLISSLCVAGFGSGFAATTLQNQTIATVLRTNPTYFITIGSLLLLADLVAQLSMVIVDDNPTWQVRLSALGLVFMIAFMVLLMSVVQQDGSLARWSETPQILLYVCIAFVVVNLACNLVVFCSSKCN